MVALTPRFTVLAAYFSLAAISLAPLSVDALTIQARHSDAILQYKNTDAGPIRQKSPVLSLPISALKSASAKKGKTHFMHEKTKSKSRKGKQHKARITDWSPINSLARLAGVTLRTEKRYFTENDLNVELPSITEINHDQQHFHLGREPTADGGNIGVSRRHPSQKAVPTGDPEGRTYPKRDQEGIPGRIDIMSEVYNSPPKKIASLVIVTTGNVTYVLNASDTNFTEIYIVNAPPNYGSTTPSGSDSFVPVLIQKQFFDSSGPDMVPYCATIEEAQTQAERMTMTPCHFEALQSQVFAYNGKTGTIQPMRYDGEDDRKTDASSISNSSANDTNPNNADIAGATSVLGERDSSEPGTQNVTLMFVPSAPEVENVEDVTPSSSPVVEIMTTTSTTTITVTSTSTSTTMTASSVIIAEVTPTSTVESSSGSIDTASSSSTDIATSSTMGASTPTLAPTGTLSVEALEPVSSSMATSDSATTTTSINAEAIASSIAASYTSSAVTTSTFTGTSTASPTTVFAAAITDVAPSSETGSASAGPMARLVLVDTEPYEWVFKADSRL